MTGFEGIFLFWSLAAAALWPPLLKDVQRTNRRTPDVQVRKANQKKLLVIVLFNLISPVLVIIAGLVNEHYAVMLAGLALVAFQLFFIRLFVRNHME